MSDISDLKVKLDCLNSELETLIEQRVDKQSELNDFELDNDDYVESYEDCLNESHGDFLGMTAAYILKNCDETAYRCGLNDYVDGIDKSNDPNYRELESELEEIEDLICDIESQIEEIEGQIADIDTTDNGEDNQ